MKKGITWILLTCLIVTSLVLASCNKTTTSTSTPTQTTTTTTKTTTNNNTTQLTTTATTTTASTGHWWDSLGTPQYGGDLVISYPRDIISFDPWYSGASMFCGWFESLTTNNWLVDPSVYVYAASYRVPELVVGLLAQTWEMPDSSTYVVHLRQGIHWQNIAPANGREFVASDVVYDYHRMYGGGDGFTTGSPYQAAAVQFQNLDSVTAPDKYTVIFKWKIANPELILEMMQSANQYNNLECPDAVKLWGGVNDWHHAIGTGPFIVTDFVSGSSLTMVKNPDYWGYDERYPQNKLPYVNTLKVLIIPDTSTQLTALRTGKVCALDSVSIASAQTILKSNPELTPVKIYQFCRTLDPKNDVVPFKDIRVRKAMQMAIDLPTIAQTYYGGGIDPHPVSLTSYYMGGGWGLSYEAWPQTLKDEYAYNTTAAKKLLADAGYPTGFKTNVVADASSDMDLLLIVKSYLAAVGIDMSIQSMDSTAFGAFVTNGHKQDQLAYKTSGVLAANQEPSRQLAYFMPGNVNNIINVNDPGFNAFYDKAMAASSVAQWHQILADANLYVAQQHFTISLLEPNVYCFVQPWLKGYNGQLGSISGGSGGTLFMGFYGARFWIDQKLKKSMGE